MPALGIETHLRPSALDDMLSLPRPIFFAELGLVPFCFHELWVWA